MCQHRTGNNTASETTQSIEEKVLQGFHSSKGPNTKTTASLFYLVWYGLVYLTLPLLHLPVCHFQPKMSSVMRGLDVSLHLTCYPHPSFDDLRTAFMSCSAFMWQGFGSRRLQGWLLWEDTNNCPYVHSRQLQNGPTTAQSSAHQQCWWCLCDKTFKKG